MQQKVLVKNMSCQNCVKHVSNHFLELDGVTAVEVDLNSQEVTVTTDTQHSLEDFQISLEETVYTAIAVKE